MLSQKINKSKIKKILVISLSNLGDVILTFPVIDILKRDFPHCELSIVVGHKASALFDGNPHIYKVHVFDKHGSIKYKMFWTLALRREGFDLVVDLRNTFIPFMIKTRYRTPPHTSKVKSYHMKTKHLSCLKTVFDFQAEAKMSYALFIKEEDRQHVDTLLKGKIASDQKIVVVSPGAADQIKRWIQDGFVELCDRLIQSYSVKIIFVGDSTDRKIAQNIIDKMKHESINLCGQISLTQLACVLERCFFAIVNDSGVMHMASYLDKPVLAIFGPTDPQRYGPWSSRSCVIQKKSVCPACQSPGKGYGHECMESISPDDVFDLIKITDAGVAFNNRR